MKNKYLLLLLMAFFCHEYSLSQKEMVYLEGIIFNTNVEKFILSPISPNSTTIDSSSIIEIIPDSSGNFNINFPFNGKDYYNFQVGKKNFFLIIDEPKTLKIFADGKNINKHLNIVGSEDSKKMFDFILVSEAWSQKIDSANRAISEDNSKSKEINEYMQKEYLSFKSQLNNFISQNMGSPALIAALGVINIEQEFKTYEKVVSSLNMSFGESKLVEAYYRNYLQYKKSLEDKNPLGIGKMAPLFEETLLKPIQGNNTFKLESLRGHVVLIDFWASWCGPCRRENPNVVNIYEKYKNKGFKIVSVSLDTDKKKWKDAIEKDNLLWPHHVSNLGGWKSNVGKLYGVSSIPFTVLIDENGKIIRTNLRGKALEDELIRIYGN